MFRSIFLLSTTVFWVTMMSQLIHREYFQIQTAQTAYEIIPITTTPIREDYRSIYLGNHRIGFDYHGFERVKDKPDYQYNHYDYELRHTAYMSFLLLGRRNEMYIKGTAWMDTQLNLKEFKLLIQSADSKTKIEGRVSASQIDVLIQNNEDPPVPRTLPASGNVLYSEALENIWTESNLKVGKRGRHQIFNPLAMTLEDLEFRVDRKENFLHGGAELPAFVVLLGEGAAQTRSWINATGVTLRKETPSGLILISEPGWEIFDSMRKELETPPDLPNLYSIPSNLPLENPKQIRTLKIDLRTPSSQQIMTLTQEVFSDIPPIEISAIDSQAYADFLKPTPFIQSDDPGIKAKAQELIRGQKTAFDAAIHIMNWVHSNVAPAPTMSIPSARKVLEERKGDCNEYTVLYTALARAAGIPAKMMAGLVYQQGRFFYHAWPVVFVGKWISLDPAFNQAPVDITHIPLTEGDLESQIRLADQIGQIHLEILDYQS